MRAPPIPEPPTLSDSASPPGGGRRRGRFVRVLPWMAFLLALLVYAVLLTRRPRPPRPALATLQLLRGLPQGSTPVGADGRATPSERLDLLVRAPARAHLVVVGLSADGTTRVLVPIAPAPKPPIVAPGAPVQVGSITLSPTWGQELILGEFCHTELDPDVVRKAAERALATAGAPEKVRGLDLGCPEARTLVQKTAAPRAEQPGAAQPR